ncbi:MAG: transporter ATP-binding protein [Microbacterium sp.]|jgi:ABC-2 type transport system ATP-binding protein|nr:transporter ATP-binding protein [Microbacterium sp.]
MQKGRQLNAVLRFDEVSFRYRRHLVFEGFSFDFSQFPVALLGPNGAGKSTLIGLSAATERARRGRIEVAGVSTESAAGRKEIRRTVSAVAQAPTGMRGLSVRELVAYTAWLKGMSHREAWDESEHALELVGLTRLSDRPSLGLSGGELRRAAIAGALCSRPTLLLLDESTVGLDPAQRESVIDTIATLSTRIPILYSTHEVDDLWSFARGVVVLDAGTVSFAGTVDEFYALAQRGETPRERASSAYARALKTTSPSTR